MVFDWVLESELGWREGRGGRSGSVIVKGR